MTAPNALPKTVTSLADVALLDAVAKKLETPCGNGSMLWRIWGQGTPVVLIHGGSGSWVHWCRNIEALVARGRMVCVPDLPGCGDSAMPPNGSDGDALPVWIDSGVCAVLGSAPFDLVGFSFGAMVSGLFSVAYPNQVRRLVLVDAAALCPASLTSVGLKPWTHLTECPEKTAAHRFNLRRLMFARDESVDELSLNLYVTGLQRDRLPKRRLPHSDILRQSLPGVGCPVWGIWGGRDVLFQGLYSSIEPSLRLAPHFNNLTVIEDAGHWVQFEEASRFNIVLQTILEN
ncbi:MAG: alpha/beta hydrolase [Betaproteobacteria bacterium]|nr:alpha/beta hydrolase [Betaproteobacteria bacterium]